MEQKTMLEIRQALGLSQQELADALARIPLRDLRGKLGDVRCFSRSMVNDWEKGRRNPDELMLLALERLLTHPEKYVDREATD